MHTLNTRARHGRSTVGTIVMVLAFALVLGGLSVVPALGQDHGRRQGQQERGRYERERQQERGWHKRERYNRRGRRVYRPYGYAAPLYAPPPVVYPPYQSPGISLFFPFHFR